MNETTFNINDFEKKHNENTYVAKKSIRIFNQIPDTNRLNIRLNDKTSLLENHLVTLRAFLIKISDFKKELIHFYNNSFNTNFNELADELWYNQLKVYGVTFMLGFDSNWYAEVTVGDYFYQDHLLDIELDENAVLSMNYDG